MTGAASVALSFLAAGCHSASLVTDNGRCGPVPKVLVPAGSYPQNVRRWCRAVHWSAR